ncbi:hypothetical protein D3C78_1373000 [compost metagenome]
MPPDRGDFRRNAIHQLFDGGIQRLHREKKQHQHRKDEKMRKRRAHDQKQGEPDAEGKNLMPERCFLPQPAKPLHGIAGGGQKMPPAFFLAKDGFRLLLLRRHVHLQPQ